MSLNNSANFWTFGDAQYKPALRTYLALLRAGMTLSVLLPWCAVKFPLSVCHSVAGASWQRWRQLMQCFICLELELCSIAARALLLLAAPRAKVLCDFKSTVSAPADNNLQLLLKGACMTLLRPLHILCLFWIDGGNDDTNSQSDPRLQLIWIGLLNICRWWVNDCSIYQMATGLCVTHLLVAKVFRHFARHPFALTVKLESVMRFTC